MWFKHPNLPFSQVAHREIILAAQQKSNTCDLTFALLQIIDDYQKELANYESEREELDLQISELEEKRDKDEEEIRSLRNKLGINE